MDSYLWRGYEDFLHTIICFLILTLSQQIVHAQQPCLWLNSKTEPVEGFVELGMPLEEALTKITFIVYKWLKSGDGNRMQVDF